MGKEGVDGDEPAADEGEGGGGGRVSGVAV